MLHRTKRPSIKVLAQMIEQVYRRDCHIPDWECMDHTDTVFVFKQGSTRIFVVRGIRPDNAEDLAACVALSANKLKYTPRFKKDIEFIKKNNPTHMDFLIGHSLGGAITDELLNQKLFKSALTFNPAVEPQYLRNQHNERYYNPSDFLYNLIGHLASNVHMVKDIPTSAQPGLNLDFFYHLLKSHMINQFIEDESKTAKHMVEYVVLNKSQFTKEQAIEWIADHKYKHRDMDETPTEYRFRQVSPEIMKTGHYKPRTVKMGFLGHLVVLYK